MYMCNTYIICESILQSYVHDGKSCMALWFSENLVSSWRMLTPENMWLLMFSISLWIQPCLLWKYDWAMMAMMAMGSSTFSDVFGYVWIYRVCGSLGFGVSSASLPHQPQDAGTCLLGLRQALILLDLVQHVLKLVVFGCFWWFLMVFIVFYGFWWVLLVSDGFWWFLMVFD